MIVLPTNATLAKYNLSRDDFIKLWDVQLGRCPICHKKFSKKRYACIDHDHETWKVRGLLCSFCNYELGVIHENLAWLDGAADYLRRPTAQRVGLDITVKGAPPSLSSETSDRGND